MTHTIGADPELFLTDKTGKFISAIGKFGGTKWKPKPLAQEGCFVQEDNVAVEFNIPPATTYADFSSSIMYCMTTIKDIANGYGLDIAIVPSAVFTNDQLKHPHARRFGCDSDFNVWKLEENPPPETTDKNLRSCGGHIHVGFREDRIGLGRAMDLFVGCPSIAFDPDIRRRLLYGKAGTVRMKSYGLEWRTASNYWLKNPDLTEMVFMQTNQAVEFVAAKNKIAAKDGEMIIDCINNADQGLLKKLTRKFKLRY